LSACPAQSATAEPKPLNHPLSPSEAQPETTRFETTRFETTRFETTRFETTRFETTQFSSKPRSLSKSLLDAARAQVR
jgi:hypothetical protein